MKDIKPEILSYEDLRKRADDFLDKFHPTRKIPIPIEEIVECGLGINIIPIPNLMRSLDGIEGFTYSNLSEIAVDQSILVNVPNRYRFTLSHEVGHIWLHKVIYEKANFNSIKGWKAFNNSIPDDEHSWFEYQAYAFAGLILVPKEQLLDEIRTLNEELIKHQITKETVTDKVREIVIEVLSKKFNISKDVIRWRIDKEEEILKSKFIGA